MNKIIARLGLIALAITLSTSVSAASVNLSFTSGYVGSSSSIQYGYDDGQTLTVSGLTATNHESRLSGVLRNVNVIQNGSWGLYTQGGTHGISNQNNPHNNQNQMLMLDFGQAVSLDSFSLRWAEHNGGSPNYGSVLAYTDEGIFNHQGLRWGELLDSGFTHAGDVNAYKNMHVGQPVDVQGGLVSRYWLIGAINPIFGGTTDSLVDAFKLGGISFTTVDVSEVPLPAAAWLFLTGLAGMAWMKKRKAKQSSELQVA